MHMPISGSTFYLTREDCVISPKFAASMAGRSKSKWDRIAGLFACPRALGFNTYALAWAAVSEQCTSTAVSKGTTSSQDSDQPVEIYQLSSDSDSQESQISPSSSGLNVRHKVFLSHSGAQKRFVEQLFEDLRAENHCPFFDKEQSSLPKGENFVPRLFKAARQCRVAVMVLSEEFLTSKWPMIELVEFLKARKNDNKDLKLLPLFYGLSVADTGDETNKSRWREAWEAFARANDSSVKAMSEALEELRRVNGLELLSFESEKAYREAIVKTILGLSPSDLRFDTSEWEGCDRLCKVLSRMFRAADIGSSQGVQKLGLYGMGGVGKTTMSKALCNFFQQDYFGRVCHVELGSEDALLLQKKVLKELAHLPEAELHRITDCAQGSTRMKQCLHQHPVFLVIDNVFDDQASRQEARAYLEAGFHEGSKIMVTARSQEVVKGLLLDPKYCKQMPNLMKEEAAVIFLRIAAPGRKVSSLSLEEQRVLNSCLDQCYFDYNYLNLDGAAPSYNSRKRKRRRRHYHPLALGALGAYYNTINDNELLAWEPRLADDSKLKYTTSAGDPPEIFRILGLQFSTFEESTKLMFLDTALSLQTLIHLRFASPQRWITWLAEIYQMSEAEVEIKINHLKRSALISVGETTITIHDLYKEYAAWYVSTRGLAMNDVRFVYQTRQDIANNNVGLPRQLERHPPGKRWPDLSRILLRHLNCNEIPIKKVREWCNVVVLQLGDCSKVAVLNLYGLNCLRHLEISGLPKLETLLFSKQVVDCDTASQRQQSVCSLVSLKLVVLYNLPVLKRLPNFSPCLNLKELSISECSTEVAASPCSCETSGDRLKLFLLKGIPYRACLEDDSPTIPSSESVQTLKMPWSRHYAHAIVLRSTLTSLRKLEIGYPGCLASLRGPMWTNSLVGLEYLSSLEELYLSELPIRKVPGLEKLTNLHKISLFNTHLVEELPHLGPLSRLRELKLYSLQLLDQIHGLDRLMQLEYLDLCYCCALTWVGDLRPLKKLDVVVLNGCDKLEGVPPHPKGLFCVDGTAASVCISPVLRVGY